MHGPVIFVWHGGTLVRVHKHRIRKTLANTQSNQHDQDGNMKSTHQRPEGETADNPVLSEEDEDESDSRSADMNTGETQDIVNPDGVNSNEIQVKPGSFISYDHD